MPASLVSCLPYTPAFHPVSVLSADLLKCALDDLVAPGDIQSDAQHSTQPFPGTLSACRLVGGGVMLIAALPAGTVVRHEWSHLSDLPSDDIIATIVLEGSGQVRQSNADLHFQRGDVFYRKARLPSSVSNETACRFLLLRLSLERFSGAHTSKYNRFTPSLARRDSPLRQSLWDYAINALPALGGNSISTIYHAERAFISLLSAVYAESREGFQNEYGGGRGDKTASRWEFLVSLLDDLLCEPDLTVTQLAQALGISARLVHKLFELHGHRYSSYLLEKRLERARADLCNPLYRQLTVAEIAYRSGFNNASHFSRSFKQRYGMPPSPYRDTAGI